MTIAMTLRPIEKRRLRLSRNPLKWWKQAHCDHHWEQWDMRSRGGVLMLSIEKCDKCKATRK